MLIYAKNVLYLQNKNNKIVNPLLCLVCWRGGECIHSYSYSLHCNIHIRLKWAFAIVWTSSNAYIQFVLFQYTWDTHIHVYETYGAAWWLQCIVRIQWEFIDIWSMDSCLLRKSFERNNKRNDGSLILFKAFTCCLLTDGMDGEC